MTKIVATVVAVSMLALPLAQAQQTTPTMEQVAKAAQSKETVAKMANVALVNKYGQPTNFADVINSKDINFGIVTQKDDHNRQYVVQYEVAALSSGKAGYAVRLYNYQAGAALDADQALVSTGAYFTAGDTVQSVKLKSDRVLAVLENTYNQQYAKSASAAAKVIASVVDMVLPRANAMPRASSIVKDATVIGVAIAGASLAVSLTLLAEEGINALGGNVKVGFILGTTAGRAWGAAWRFGLASAIAYGLSLFGAAQGL